MAWDKFQFWNVFFFIFPIDVSVVCHLWYFRLKNIFLIDPGCLLLHDSSRSGGDECDVESLVCQEMPGLVC